MVAAGGCGSRGRMRVAALRWLSEADWRRQDGVGDDAERGAGNGERGRRTGRWLVEQVCGTALLLVRNAKATGRSRQKRPKQRPGDVQGNPGRMSGQDNGCGWMELWGGCLLTLRVWRGNHGGRGSAGLGCRRRREGLWQGNRARTRPVQLPTLVFCHSSLQTDDNLQQADTDRHLPSPPWPPLAHGVLVTGLALPCKKMKQTLKAMQENMCHVGGGDLRK